MMNRQQPPPSVVVRMRIEDVLTEEVVAEMRDQYLNVEKLIMMLQQFPLTPEGGGDANGGSNVVLNTLQRVADCQKNPFEDIYSHSVVIVSSLKIFCDE
eukprot:jgi/Picre1/30659/NNA_006020.t1